jgi:hypothetical protein
MLQERMALFVLSRCKIDLSSEVCNQQQMTGFETTFC